MFTADFAGQLLIVLNVTVLFPAFVLGVATLVVVASHLTDMFRNDFRKRRARSSG